ncbi:TetR/AcrR family transcriptional regulator [Kitasatospora sp. NPDC002543]
MGHREDLLAGAQRCLIEIGYARTTTRDIVAASGTNLASIGYHYGSKEALLNEALIRAIESQGEQLAMAMAAVDYSGGPMERFENIWTVVVDNFNSHRTIWLGTFEVFAQVDRAPMVREALAATIQQGRQGLAMLFHPESVGLPEETRQALGSFFQALMTGIMTQWLVDPENSPTGHGLAEALRVLQDWKDVEPGTRKPAAGGPAGPPGGLPPGALPPGALPPGGFPDGPPGGLPPGPPPGPPAAAEDPTADAPGGEPADVRTAT